MINTFPEVKISLTLGKGDHLELVLIEALWPVDIDSFFQVHKSLSKCPPSQGSII